MKSSRRKIKSTLCKMMLNAGLIFLAETAMAEPLYVVYGSRGVVTFTSRKPSESQNFKVFKPQSAPRYSRYRAIRSPGPMRARLSIYDELIKKTAEEQEVEPALVKAVVHVESAFNPLARSNKGAIGLMQLMPDTAKRFGVKNIYRPEENVEGGVKYLKTLLKRYEGKLHLVLAAYNAGENAVDQYQGIPPYSETQDYVRKVLSTVTIYRCATSGRSNC